MAIIYPDEKYLSKKTKMGTEEIEKVLTKLGFPSERIDENKIEIEITPNRPDMFGWEGIIRTLRLYMGLDKPKKYVVDEIIGEVKVKEVEERPFIGVAVVEGIKDREFLFESLITLQEKLDKTIGRNRKKVAIGLHDFDKIEGDLIYEKVENDSFIPLEGEEELELEEILKKTKQGVKYGHLINGKKPIIRDNKGIISFPPIINSERTRINENTKSILIDVTGTNKKAVEECLNIIVCSIVEREGKIKGYKIKEELYPKLNYKKMKLEKNKIEKLIGMEFKEEEKLLERMGLIKEGNFVYIPPYRVDFMDYSDIAEELAISYGYENIKEEKFEYYQEGFIEEREEYIKEVLVSLGFKEVYNYFIVSRENVEFFGFKEKIKLKNALSKEHNSIRPSLIIGLIKNIRDNKKEKLPLKFFEIGRVYEDKEEKRVGLIIADERVSIDKGIKMLNSFLGSLGYDYKIEKEDKNYFIKGRSVKIKGENFIGFLGEISPHVNEKYNIDLPMLYFEISLPL